MSPPPTPQYKPPPPCSYSVLVDGAEWFTSTGGNAGGFAYCISGKCVAASALHLHSTTSSSGTDGAGDFTALTLNWSSSSLSSSSSQPQRPAAAGGATAEWATTFKAYTDKGRSAIVFQQTWLVVSNIHARACSLSPMPMCARARVCVCVCVCVCM